MKVSVVIPAYNEEKFIGRCLESLSKQTRLPDEIIVVDNNCTDNTVAIARSFGVGIVKEKKQGITPARNSGMDAASGDIIIRTDADAIYPRNWISLIVKDFKRGVVAVGGPVLFAEMRLPKKMVNLFFQNLHNFENFIFSRPMLIGPCMAVRADAWGKVKPSLHISDKEVHEDMDLAYKLSNYGKVIFDWNIRTITSHRRLVKNPYSMLVEYPIRFVKTWLHVKGLKK